MAQAWVQLWGLELADWVEEVGTARTGPTVIVSEGSELEWGREGGKVIVCRLVEECGDRCGRRAKRGENAEGQVGGNIDNRKAQPALRRNPKEARSRSR